MSSPLMIFSADGQKTFVRSNFSEKADSPGFLVLSKPKPMFVTVHVCWGAELCRPQGFHRLLQEKELLCF